MRKLTLEEAKARTEARGFRWLSESFGGVNQKHLFECGSGHEWEATPANVWHGYGCPHCARERRGDKKRLSIEEARAKTEARGFRFLSETYEGNEKKHRFACSSGHEWEATPANVWHGYGCPHCARERRGDKKRLSIDEAIVKTEARGFRLLSETYEGAAKTHRFACGQGHVWEATPDSVWRANGCPHCAGKIPLTLEDARKRTEARGFRFLSETYEGNKKKRLFGCPKGHEWEATPDSIWAGHGCPICSIERRGDALRFSLENAKAKTKAMGFRWLSQAYLGARVKHRFACSSGHEWEARPANVWKGHGCPICSSFKSESLVRDVLEEDFGVATEKVRPDWLRHRKGKPLELDGIQKNLGFAWEHQGDQHFIFEPFFHRGGEKDFRDQQERDAFKREATALQKILLFEIPQTERATREKIKETIEREAERLCLPFAFNPQFREMMAQAGL